MRYVAIMYETACDEATYPVIEAPDADTAREIAVNVAEESGRIVVDIVDPDELSNIASYAEFESPDYSAGH